MNLNGQTALVTGGGKRIGREISLALAKAGADVIVHYWGSEAGANEVAGEIRALGKKASLVRADLSIATGPAELAEAARKISPQIDILINNASVYPASSKRNAGKDILHESIADWELSLDVNARAPFFLIQALAPTLQQSKHGNIINILDSSISIPFYSRASHTVSKCALLAVTKLAAGTLSPAVRVNALELGKILPPEGLPAAAAVNYSWSGAQCVVDAILFVLGNHFINGEVVSIRGNEGLPSNERKDEW